MLIFRLPKDTVAGLYRAILIPLPSFFLPPGLPKLN